MKNLFKKYLVLVPMMGTLFLTACNSGGNTNGAVSPTVSLVSPTDGTTQVEVTTPIIKILFSQVVNNVNPTNVVLKDINNQGITLTIAKDPKYNNSNVLYDITSMTNLKYNMKYNLSIKDGITTSNGNKLVPSSFTFTTRNINLSWVKQLGSNDGATYGYSVSTSSDGNIYLLGSTTKGLSGNVQNGKIDSFLAKYDNKGNLSWVKQLGVEDGATEPRSVYVNKNGNIFISGSTTKGLYGNIQNGIEDAFLAKYDNQGNLSWVKQIGTTSGSTFPMSVNADSDENVYIAGITDKGLNGNIQNGERDSFLAKYDQQGNLSWVKQLGAKNGFTSGYSTVATLDGNIYVAGLTNKPLYDNPALNDAFTSFLAKYKSNGEILWVKQLGSVNGVSGGYAVSAISDGSVYVAGYTTKGINGNTQTGFVDSFVAKYNSAGNVSWVKQLGATKGATYAYSISNNNDSIYITGFTDKSLDGSIQNGQKDSFVAKYDSAGNISWIKQLGAIGGETIGNEVAVDQNGAIYIAGQTNKGLDNNHQIGLENAFLAKYY